MTSLSTKNILVVDDDPVCNFICGKFLERIGLTPEIALNGKAGLHLLNDIYQRTGSAPDVILLDLNMPVMDGFAFLESFKKLDIPDKENIRIVVLSSSDDPKDMKRAQTLGVDEYIVKPISEPKLTHVLRNRE